MVEATAGGGRDTNSSVAITVAAKLGNKKKILKLPLYLRSKKDSDVYDPKVVSIGPYHHGKPELQLLQGIKRKVLDHFISSSSSSRQQDYEFYFKKMLEVVHKARSCYILMEKDNDKFDDDSQFAEMMLLDGCFLLNQFLMDIPNYYGYDDDVDDDVVKALIKYYSPLDTRTLIDVAGGLLFTERDTLLLDNQIPLWIIELLFNARYGNNNPPLTWKQLLSMRTQVMSWKEIVYKSADDLDKHLMQQQLLDDDEPPLHLLEFYHMLAVFRQTIEPSSSGESSPIQMSNKEFIDEYGYIFRSVMDLKSKGIHCSLNHSDLTLSAIKFESTLLRATLKLPPFEASNSNQVYLQNIIAYEICNNWLRPHFVVGSYVNFLKSLIVSPGDVKELREKRIIQGTLWEDNEVVQFFRGLNTYELDNPIIFKDLKHQILKYYNSKTNTWIADLGYTYFSSPWTAIALVAATFLLLLTFLQTYFTINPRRGRKRVNRSDQSTHIEGDPSMQKI